MAAKAWVNPTLYVMKAGIERQREAREREGRLTPELEAQLEASRRALDVRVEAVRQMSEAGVLMTAGSDSPWGWYAPGEFVHEIHMLAQAGLSYSDAIVAGTAGAAESIGVGAVAGRLLPGRLADVLVVRGDPTREITALWDVLDVYQAGRASSAEWHDAVLARLVQMAGGEMPSADLAQRGALDPAAVEGHGAARVEAAARRARRAGSPPRPCGTMRSRRRAGSATGTAESSTCVYGCLASRWIAVARADLHDLAQVHHGHAIRHVQDDVEVVRDEEIGQAEAAPEVHEQVQHLGLDGHVERRHRLVGHDEARLQARAPPRCRCAGAGRPRARAG